MVTLHHDGVLEPPLEQELDPELQEKLAAYPGRLVAITRSKLIAVGDEPSEVLRKAREKGFISPILYRVPDAEGTSYFF